MELYPTVLFEGNYNITWVANPGTSITFDPGLTKLEYERKLVELHMELEETKEELV